jgi:hypothetical protein
MGISQSGQFDDVNNSNYLAASINITTSQTEAKVGGSTLNGRQMIIIENRGNNDIYYGPSGVTSSTGIRLAKNQVASLPFGDSVAIFLITATGSSTAIIQEIG